MYSFVLQDWLTIQGGDTTPVYQTERDWLDMTPYQDVVVWIDVRDLTGSVKLTLETAPARDDVLFQGLGTEVTLAVGLTVVQYLMGSATVPIAQFLRWKLACTTSPWQTTFRLFVAANAPGLQLPDGSTPLLLRPEM